MSAWQPIETAPQDYCEILAYKPSIGRVLVRWDAKGDDGPGYYETWDGNLIEGLTHWHPLPSEPISAATP